jgi:hypothetical protein
MSWVVTQCSLVGDYQFGGAYRLENRDGGIILNTDNHIPRNPQSKLKNSW